jgi:hypothetical protein
MTLILRARVQMMTGRTKHAIGKVVEGLLNHRMVRLMKTLATIGVRIQVTPCAELEVRLSEQDADNYIVDPAPFEFLVEGWLEDAQIFYGLYGPVISGPERYHNLICNIFVRYDHSDWRNSSKDWANFKVGPTKATRCHSHASWHPAGTVVSGFPRICRYGEICVV